jgi:hypothetical protein
LPTDGDAGPVGSGKIAKVEASGDQAGAPTQRLLRLIFSLQGGTIVVADQHVVEMVAPAGDPVVGFEGQTGFWYEVRNAAEQVLFRQVVHDPIPRSAEVFGKTPEEPLARLPMAEPSGAFTVLLPLPDDADHVALVGTPLEELTGVAAAAELARFPIPKELLP